MRITTNNKGRGRFNGWTVHVFSWVLALALCGGAYYILKRTDLFASGANATQTINHRSPNANKELKKAQSKRELPKKYAVRLVEESEEKAKTELFSQIRKFQEMSAKMRKRRDDMLTKIENRRLPAGAPSNANDTRIAREIRQVPAPNVENMSAREIYDLLREYEAEIQANHVAVSAAKQALSRGQSFPDVYRSLQSGSTKMPTYDELLAMQSRDGVINVGSTEDLNAYRDLLGNANRQAGLAVSRLSNLFGSGRNIARQNFADSKNRSVDGSWSGTGNPGDGSGNGNGNGNGNGQGGMGMGQGGNIGGDGGGEGEGDSGNDNDGVAKTPYSSYAGRKLNPAMVKAQALPGRRFSKDSAKKGWLYVNTWYMIGPWESYGRNDFSIVHPPEISIDFDAVYTDGQKGIVGVEETDSDPIKMVGRKVMLDGVLRWKFMQSESLHNVVPVTTGHSTYYAYTELYFEEATTMLVAIGTDDSGRVWINDKDVWQDSGTSWYNIDEHIAPFKFRQGWNKILVRLENGGGGPAGFSFLILPKKQ